MYGRRVLSVLVAPALAFALANCGSSPTSPSSNEGATLRGQFRQRNASPSAQRTAGSFHHAQTASLADPVAVMVLDSAKQEIATVNIVGGAFTIRGLPEFFYLRFLDANGDAIGEDMLFQGVKPNQEVDIVVAMRNGEIVLVRERRTGIDHQGSSGIEIEGTATNVVVDNPPGDEITGSLEVGGYAIVTQKSQTSIRKGNRNLTLADIDGKQVHVRGVFQDDGRVFAHEIKLQDETDEEQKKDTPPVCNAPDPAKSNHILICHKGRTKSVSPNAWSGHYGHGDSCGPC